MITLAAPVLADYWPTLGSLLFALAGLVLGLIGKSFLPSYFSEKGRNLATKEDIEGITNQIEGVKSDYAKQHQELVYQHQLTVEAMKAHTQMSLAAVESRLAAHQQAFALWRKLLKNIHDESARDVVKECEAWWNDNCLYLSPDARQGFLEAFWGVNDHPALLKDRSNPTAATENFNRIIRVGEKITGSVALPPIGGRELQSVTDPLSSVG